MDKEHLTILYPKRGDSIERIFPVHGLIPRLWIPLDKISFELEDKDGKIIMGGSAPLKLYGGIFSFLWWKQRPFSIMIDLSDRTLNYLKNGQIVVLVFDGPNKEQSVTIPLVLHAK